MPDGIRLKLYAMTGGDGEALSLYSSMASDHDASPPPAYHKHMRILNMVVGCLGIGFAFHIQAFGAYSNAIKDIFDFDQSQVETILAMGFLGLGTTWPAGVVFEKFGPKKTSSFGLISCVAFFLMWTATQDPDYYHDHFYLFALYMFLAGCGGGFMFVVATSVNLGNYASRKHGLINGILQAFTSTGPGIIILIYDIFFVNDHVLDPINQNLSGFFITMSILFLVLTVVGVIVYGYYPEDPISLTRSVLVRSVNSIDFTNHEDTRFATEMKQYVNRLTEKDSGKEIWIETRLLRGLSVVKDPKYYLVALPMVFLASLEGVYVTNITTFLFSFDLAGYTLIVPMINPAFGTIFTPLMGYIADTYIHVIPRTSYIFVLAIVSSLVYVLNVFFADCLPYFVFSIIIIELAYYAVMVLSPLLLIELYGIKNFSSNYGMTMMGYGVGVVILAEFLGIFYKAEIPETPGVRQTYCYGLECYFAYFCLGAVLSFVSAILTLPLFYAALTKRIPKNMHL